MTINQGFPGTPPQIRDFARMAPRTQGDTLFTFTDLLYRNSQVEEMHGASYGAGVREAQIFQVSLGALTSQHLDMFTSPEAHLVLSFKNFYRAQSPAPPLLSYR